MRLRRFQPPRLGDERGFTLAVAMGLMLIASITCVAAFQAANGDLVPSGENSDRKIAYAAAESGVNYYQSKLTANPDYWQKCETGKTGGVDDPVNQPSVAAASRKWRPVSGTGKATADFSVAMLPVKTVSATCVTTNPDSMISKIDGSFKVRSTGRYHGETRSIVTSFRRQRFLDFIYFTDYETLDPDTFGGDASCGQYRAQRPTSCTEIQFGSNDKVNGPLHTNDDLIVCGTPKFGRNSDDTISISGPDPGFKGANGCGTTIAPSWVGSKRTGQRQLQLPPTNAALKTLTTAGTSGQGYRLTGTQYIRFNNDGTMTIDTPSGNPYKVNLPTNGVIYVETSPSLGCSTPKSPQATDYVEGPGCANAYVSGTADKSVTLTSERDIIVAPTSGSTSTSNQFDPATAGSGSTDADLKINGTLDADQQLSGTVQAGLIATKYVRVYHRIDPNNGSLASGVRNVRIDAAILSLQHSFIVDNWAYGPSPGTLQVHGAIAQRFRGPVGTGTGGGVTTGYAKDYWYDNRLRYRSPPYFLDPVNAAWGVDRQNELLPAV